MACSDSDLNFMFITQCLVKVLVCLLLLLLVWSGRRSLAKSANKMAVIIVRFDLHTHTLSHPHLHTQKTPIFLLTKTSAFAAPSKKCHISYYCLLLPLLLSSPTHHHHQLSSSPSLSHTLNTHTPSRLLPSSLSLSRKIGFPF